VPEQCATVHDIGTLCAGLGLDSARRQTGASGCRRSERRLVSASDGADHSAGDGRGTHSDRGSGEDIAWVVHSGVYP